MKRTYLRILLDIAMAAFIIFGWWPAALVISLVAGWMLPVYWIETIAAGILYDSLYGYIPEGGLVSYAGTILSLIVSISIIFSRKVVRKSRI